MTNKKFQKRKTIAIYKPEKKKQNTIVTSVSYFSVSGFGVLDFRHHPTIKPKPNQRIN